MTGVQRAHAMPYGAEPQADGQVRFRLWAPAARQVELCLEDDGEALVAMEADGDDGWYQLVTARAGHGSRYRFRIDHGLRVPDPASRYQPEDVHGPSVVIDPSQWSWRDGDWRGRPWAQAVLYELHVGSFTARGDFDGVRGRLDQLAELGVTAIELMPVADFPGARNWGYDGVLPFAPDSRYGRPEDLKALVDAAHARGLMVFMDVVYNHFGPDGNYLGVYAPQFFTDRHHTPWGAAINFDGADSRWVREYFIHNALYWLEEYHLDGLRLDAVHAIMDDSDTDILAELAARVAAGPGAERAVHLVLENDDNAAHYLARTPDGRTRAYAAQWNDDIHHVLHLLLTGEDQGYYADYADQPLSRLGRCLTEGFAYQGEPSSYRGGQRRGEATRGLPITAFVSFLQNHDQVGNRAYGERLTALTSIAGLRCATALLLLAPSPPLLFMGQEWGCRQPFPFFCDFDGDLAWAVTDGRRREFARFPAFADPAARARIPDPNAVSTFESAVLDYAGAAGGDGQAWLDLHRQLLALRHNEIVPHLGDGRCRDAQYALVDGRGLSVSWTLADGITLMLCANLSATPLDRPPASGRLIYMVNDDARVPATLAPWALRAWIAD